MHETRVARPYAKSLLELAEEKGELEEVNKDMSLFVEVAQANNQFQNMLKNPIISHDKKQAVLDTIFKGRVSDMSLAMFRIITHKNREAFLYDIAKEFTSQYKAFKGISTAEVTTTYPLTQDQKNTFINMVAKKENKKVELLEKVDESILGGFVLKVGDIQVDESIKSKLHRLKNKFKDNSYISKL
jgi:F-type H+-transporting ATPase subunit delta